MVANDGGMVKPLQQGHFVRELLDLGFRLAFELDPFDCNDLSRIEVESAVHRTELAFADTFSQLLYRKPLEISD